MGIPLLYRASAITNFILLLYIAFYLTLLSDDINNNTTPTIKRFNKTFPCNNITPRSFNKQRGSYWVLHNYIKSVKIFNCDESITLTTHSDFTFLDNLEPLLERWQGPISISLYTPGTDFEDTIARILYLRECGSSLVKDFVSFHFFFDTFFDHVPKYKIYLDPLKTRVNCSTMPIFGNNITMYKKLKNLTYPVNVARNVAREMATTHYILSSDIELYPSVNLIPNFLEMIRRNDSNIQRPNPKVFVLSIFEVNDKVEKPPKDKKDLLIMLGNYSASPFHKFICQNCHAIPEATKWRKTPILDGLRVFHVAKRHNLFRVWEPIYIGTKNDPMYDERLTWEGRKDKMTQALALCVLDYEFHILDNAFLVHRPGIKKKIIAKSNQYVSKQNNFIRTVIKPELLKIYGNRKGCVV